MRSSTRAPLARRPNSAATRRRCRIPLRAVSVRQPLETVTFTVRPRATQGAAVQHVENNSSGKAVQESCKLRANKHRAPSAARAAPILGQATKTQCPPALGVQHKSGHRASSAHAAALYAGRPFTHSPSIKWYSPTMPSSAGALTMKRRPAQTIGASLALSSCAGDGNEVCGASAFAAASPSAAVA